MVWRGRAGHGGAWHGKAGPGGRGVARLGEVRRSGRGEAWSGLAGLGGQTPLTPASVVHNVTTMQGHRQSLTLTQPQREFLASEAARLGVTVSEIVRRIVDQYREARNA